MGDKNYENRGELRIQNGDEPAIVFFQEKNLFGNRTPTQAEWLKHAELYAAIENRIDASHIVGIQRVRGMWRIYLQCVEDKVVLLATGLALRGSTYQVLSTNPNRLDGEATVSIRVMDIPLSVEDGVISRTFILKGLEIISTSREKLKINGKITTCETGDRFLTVKASSLKEPMPKFLNFGKYQGRVYHRGQLQRETTCSKCLEKGHRAAGCPNDWKCTACNQFGHKKADCLENNNNSDNESAESESSSSEDTEVETSVEDLLDPELPHKNLKKKNKKSKAGKQIPGQQDILEFIKNSKLQNLTPNKGKQSVVERSPPTPIDKQNTTNKKHRNDKNANKQR